MTASWETAFVAMSAILGQSRETIVDALGNNGAARAAPLLNALHSDSRERRAHAIANALARVASEIESLRYTWRSRVAE